MCFSSVLLISISSIFSVSHLHLEAQAFSLRYLLFTAYFYQIFTLQERPIVLHFNLFLLPALQPNFNNCS